MAEKIAIIGDRESIKGFAAIGFDIFECTADRAASILKAAAETEEYKRNVKNTKKKCSPQLFPYRELKAITESEETDSPILLNAR